MRLFIADTNDRVRQRLASIAASVEGISVVGEAGEVGEAVVGIKRAKPDSVIVALPLSGGSGLDVLSAAKSANPTSTTIMLTLSPCSECERKCFAMGADYFYQKSSDMKKIVTTLVLLAHEACQRGLENKQKTGQKSPSASSSFSPRTPVICPRIATAPALNNNFCYIAGVPTRTASGAYAPLTS
jgi:DNA-binding NarL/FixJ family response regulator